MTPSTPLASCCTRRLSLDQFDYGDDGWNSDRPVKLRVTHVSSVLRKLQLSSRHELTRGPPNEESSEAAGSVPVAIGRLAGVSFEARDAGAETAGHGQGAEILGQLGGALGPEAGTGHRGTTG